MPLTITTHDGQLYAVELELATTVENLQLVVEIESGVPVAEQRLIHHGQALSDPTKTLRELGIEQDDVIILERQSPASGQQQQPPPPPYSTHTPTSIGSQGQQVNPELMRQHVLSDPRLLQQLRAAQPELANAVNNPQQFAQLISNMEQERRQAVATRQREIMSLNADPFDVEAQRRIEEAIRQENVLSNMEAALEYNPESFGVVSIGD
ncbi:ubiquitin-related domain-containing protein [Syncephalis plumigaleata]|nr:ubiquitin-related domain-containing protein [Syncephalis plumigaleata]